MQDKLISGDNHIDLTYLPPDLWSSEVPAKWKLLAPRVEEMEDGLHWFIEAQDKGMWNGIGPGFLPYQRGMFGHIDEMKDLGFEWNYSRGAKPRPTTPELRLADLDRDGSAPATRAEREQERRSFDFSRSIDGMGFGSLTLDPLGAEHVETALRAAYGALHAAADPRTPAQQRADALVEICRTYSGTRDPRANLPTVLVVVDGPTLEGDMVGECRLASGFRIAPDTARRVACDARVQELVVSDTGIPLALGRAARTFSPGQYRALVVRDHHCRARLPRRRRPLRGASPRRMESRPWSNRSRQWRAVLSRPLPPHAARGRLDGHG